MVLLTMPKIYSNIRKQIDGTIIAILEYFNCKTQLCCTKMEQKLFYSESFNIYVGSNDAPYRLIKYPDIQVKPQHDTLIQQHSGMCML